MVLFGLLLVSFESRVGMVLFDSGFGQLIELGLLLVLLLVGISLGAMLGIRLGTGLKEGFGDEEGRFDGVLL